MNELQTDLTRTLKKVNKAMRMLDDIPNGLSDTIDRLITNAYEELDEAYGEINSTLEYLKSIENDN
jgi:hypothetical protein